jgi:hypothetical protein
VETGTVTNLLPATSATIKWYNSLTSGTALTTTTALATGTYYVLLKLMQWLLKEILELQ